MILAFLSIISISAQETDDSISKHWFITGIDAELFCSKYLTDWKLERKEIKWNCGREFLFVNKDSSKRFFMTVGVYESEVHACGKAREFMSDVNIYFQPGREDFQKVVGDSAWYCMKGSDPSEATYIVFIRNNVLFILGNVNNSEGLFEIAKIMDKNILSHSDYVKINSLFFPLEISIDVEKIEQVKTYSYKITVNSNTSNDDPCEYQLISTMQLIKTAKNNQYLSFPLLKGEGFNYGLFTIRVISVSSLNLVSNLFEKNIEF
jgi:hypothetical protein